MDPELIKLIEDNSLTLHGDIEFFAYLVAKREREACIRLVWNTPQADDEYVCHKDTIAAAIRARGGDA